MSFLFTLLCTHTLGIGSNYIVAKLLIIASVLPIAPGVWGDYKESGFLPIESILQIYELYINKLRHRCQ